MLGNQFRKHPSSPCEKILHSKLNTSIMMLLFCNNHFIQFERNEICRTESISHFGERSGARRHVIYVQSYRAHTHTQLSDLGRERFFILFVVVSIPHEPSIFYIILFPVIGNPPAHVCGTLHTTEYKISRIKNGGKENNRNFFYYKRKINESFVLRYSSAKFKKEWQKAIKH